MKKSLKRWLVLLCAALLSLTAAMPVFAEEMVSVTVPNVRGGYLSVFYQRPDGVYVYLPVGETAQVPKGTELIINDCPLDYEPDDYTYYESFTQSVKANGQELYDSENYTVSEWVASENTTLEAVFKGHETKYDGSIYGTGSSLGWVLWFENAEGEFSPYTGMLNPGVMPSKKLVLTDEKKSYGFDSVEIKNIERVSYSPISGPLKDITGSGLLSISQDGTLSASAPLEAGTYRIRIKYDYERRKNITRNLMIYVGARVYIDYPFVLYKDTASGVYESVSNISSASPIPVNDLAIDTFQDIYNRYTDQGNSIEIANHPDAVGLGLYDGKTDSYLSIMQDKVNSKITKDYAPYTSVEVMISGFKPAVVEPLTASDIVPGE